jgi:hypothetical protein
MATKNFGRPGCLGAFFEEPEKSLSTAGIHDQMELSSEDIQLVQEMVKDFFARSYAGKKVVITQEYRQRFSNEYAWKRFEEIIQEILLQSAGRKVIENLFS